MSERFFDDIFKAGSKTYFYSSFFFPSEIKKDVFVLYGFVRTVDNFVDSNPQKKKEFYSFKKEFFLARKGKKINNKIINEFILLEKRKKFEKKWANDFIKSMERDLIKKKMKTLKEIEKYMHGSAEVIGLFMAKIFEINKKAYTCARLLGKAMQYINFIRDIDEDIQLQRNYFPEKDYTKAGLNEYTKSEFLKNKKGFNKFIKMQIKRYKQWQKEAEKGYKYLPKKYLIPVKTAADMYNWTAKEIEKNPQIVFRKKVKPNIAHIVGQGFLNKLAIKEGFDWKH